MSVDQIRPGVGWAKAPATAAAYELEALSLTSARARAAEGYWLFFCRWARAHRRECLPASGQTLALFLYSQKGYWGWSTSRKAADAVRLAHEWIGLHDPSDHPSVRRYLTSLRRTAGRREEQRTSPLRASDVVAILDVPTTREPGVHAMREAACRAALVLGRRAEAALRQLAKMRPDDIVLGQEVVEVSLPECPAHAGRPALPGRVVRLHRTDTALCPVTACEQLLEHRSPSAGLLFDVRPATCSAREVSPAQVAAAISSMMRTVAGRAHLADRWAATQGLSQSSSAVGDDRRPDAVGGVQYFGAQLGEQEIERMGAFCSIDRLEQMRDRLYVLLGVALCRRHAELRLMRRHHLQRCADGFDVTVPESKNPQQKQKVIFLERTGGPACPVQWLEAWLRMLDDAGYSDPDAYLLPAVLYGKVAGQLPSSTGRMCARLQKLAHHLDELAGSERVLGRAPRIGTRSLRVGGITTLSEAGANAVEIAQVSLHRSQEQLAVYLRFEDPVTNAHHLNV